MGQPLSLELGTFPVDRVELGSRTKLVGSVLEIDADDLCRRLLPDSSIAGVEVALAHPGEPTRLVHVVDLVEPRVKVSGGPGVFPGILGPARTVGRGRTHRLQGVAVAPVAVLPQATSDVLRFTEGVIDMAGPGVSLCHGSDTVNVVLSVTPRPGASNAEFDRALRRATLRAAVYLAETTTALRAPLLERLSLDRHDGLPRVVYIDQVQSQGLLVATLFYGREVGELVPTLVHPNECFDGAVVSGNYKTSMKIPTIVHCENPAIRSLYRRHGRDLDFAGVILSRGHHDDHALKERSAQHAANLARMVGADGAVLSMEGTGNGNVDYMFTVEACEDAGIAAVPLVHEFGGPDGRDTPLVDSSPKAVSMVSTGSIDKVVELPPVRRVIGGETIVVSSGERLDAAGALRLTVFDLFASFRKMAVAGIRCVEF